MKHSPRADLSAADFAHQLKLHHFADMRGEYLDLGGPYGQPRGGRIAPVMAGRRVHRKATLAALLKSRAERVAVAEAETARKAEQERIAGLIAPVAVPPPRADLADELAIATLADDLVNLAARGDSPTLPDLLRIGWRRDQVFQHIDTARNVAYARQGGNAA